VISDYTRRRLGLVVVLLVAATTLLVVRLVSVQVVQGAAYRQKGLGQRRRPLSLPAPPRGCIWDRDGFLLAGNQVWYAVEVSPAYITDVTTVATQLAPVLHTSPDVLSATLGSEQEWLEWNEDVTWEQGEAIERMGFSGVDLRLRWKRFYPQGELTAHVLGFVSEMGEDGFYGLEGFYDDILQPRLVTWEGEVDAMGYRPLPFEEGTIAPPLPGVDLHLTLDLAMQTAAAEELARGLGEFGAESGLVVVMDPHSGAILAMVGIPSYDPHQYEAYLGDELLLANPAVSLQYEPGSVFKIVTMAAALDSGTVTPDTAYVDEGQIEYGGVVTRNWDRRAYGQQDMRGVLVHSLNVGAVWLSVQMGPEVFYRYVRAFGFGSLTGVDLQGEAAGRVLIPGDLDWHDSELATNAYGQGIAVTPLQMASAVAAVANGGRLMCPYLVDRQVMPDGSVQVHQPVVRGQPISPQTARTLTEMLVQVVEEGVPLARVPGYRVAGKTGTAQIPVPGGYDEEDTIASFVGFGPADDPQLLILVRLDRPQTSRWGSETAAVVFSRLAARLFPMAGIPPQE